MNSVALYPLLKPYYETDELINFNAIETLLQRFAHDASLLSYLKGLLGKLDEDNLDILAKFSALKLFKTLIAPSLAAKILKQFANPSEILSSIELATDTLDNEHLVAALTLALYQHWQFPNASSYPDTLRILDLNFNDDSLVLYQTLPKSKYIVLSDHPQKFPQLPIEIQKGVIYHTSNYKIFFDKQGQGHLNVKAATQNINDGYPTLTLADAIKKYKPNLLKFTLSELTLTQLESSAVVKALKKHNPTVIINLNTPISAIIDITSFSLPELFAHNISVAETINKLASRHQSFNFKLQIKPNELNLIMKSV